MYGIIKVFVVSVFLRAGVCVAECNAYVFACDVLDLLVQAAQGTVRGEELRDAVDNFLRACLAANWRQFLHPKFHWMLHLVIELVRFGLLLTCWVHERKHRMVKRFTIDLQNTRKYETSLLSETSRSRDP